LGALDERKKAGILTDGLPRFDGSIYEDTKPEASDEHRIETERASS